MASEKVEKQERIREEGEFQDKEKFITESYARQLELNKKEEMIVQMEEKLNKDKTMTNHGMMGFYNKMFDGESKDTSNNDVRETAKSKVVAGTNIDKILDNNEAIRQEEQKGKDIIKQQTIRKEMEEILKTQLTKSGVLPPEKLKKREEKLDKKQKVDIPTETPDMKKIRLKLERQEKIRKAKERYK